MKNPGTGALKEESGWTERRKGPGEKCPGTGVQNLKKN